MSMHPLSQLPGAPKRGHAAAAAHPAPVSPEMLEPLLVQVEQHLEGLGLALKQRDPQAIDLHASQLHRALVLALESFASAAQSGPIASTLRARLARAGSQIAVQRDCLARAAAALDRAIDVMLPRSAASGPGLYSASGKTSIDTHSVGVRV